LGEQRLAKREQRKLQNLSVFMRSQKGSSKHNGRQILSAAPSSLEVLSRNSLLLTPFFAAWRMETDRFCNFVFALCQSLVSQGIC